jgi:hypothetical protein
MKATRYGKMATRRFLFWLFFTVITCVMLIVAAGADAELASGSKLLGNINHSGYFSSGF